MLILNYKSLGFPNLGFFPVTQPTSITWFPSHHTVELGLRKLAYIAGILATAIAMSNQVVCL